MDDGVFVEIYAPDMGDMALKVLNEVNIAINRLS